MLDKLQDIKHRWEDIGEKLGDPATMLDMKKYAQLSKEYKDLQPVVDAYNKYANIMSNIDENKDKSLKQSNKLSQSRAKWLKSRVDDLFYM